MAFLMAISRFQAMPLDDTGGVGDGHEEIVEVFQGGKGHGGTVRDSATPAELGVEQPGGQESAGHAVVAGDEKIINTRDCFPCLVAVDLLSAPGVPRVVNRQQIAVVRSV